MTRRGATVKALVESVGTTHSGFHTDEGIRMNSNDRNEISTEPSPGPEDNDNLGAEDGKGTPPTVPPKGEDDENGSPVDAEHPDQD
jgi:hypothetical protein